MVPLSHSRCKQTAESAFAASFVLLTLLHLSTPVVAAGGDTHDQGRLRRAAAFALSLAVTLVPSAQLHRQRVEQIPLGAANPYTLTFPELRRLQLALPVSQRPGSLMAYQAPNGRARQYPWTVAYAPSSSGAERPPETLLFTDGSLQRTPTTFALSPEVCLPDACYRGNGGEPSLPADGGWQPMPATTWRAGAVKVQVKVVPSDGDHPLWIQYRLSNEVPDKITSASLKLMWQPGQGVGPWQSRQYWAAPIASQSTPDDRRA